jgi:transcription-repair coupling factor (superfamily II helicase)
MSGIRELSLIATAPAKRLSVKTFVHPRNKTIIREAILREVLRGGQVYYLHNEVNTIEHVAQEITQLIPEANVKIAHGQMRERELERVMSDFYHQRFNILICTTIIETGIDIPSANTIIIDNADHFGVAQLHQLRGRVGRSHHQAYAYLLTPAEAAISRDAKKRLEAIAAHDDLGVGFILATHDLEIRGAGDLLGEDQSGNIQAIGFSLYMELLDRTVKALKAGKDLPMSLSAHSHTEVDLKISALIPDDYLSDVHQRLVLYKRLASAANDDALRELKVEMIDRFGSLPDALKNLLEIHHVKLAAANLGIRKIEGGNLGGILEFAPNPAVDPKKIIHLIQTQPQKYKLEKGNRLRYCLKSETASVRLMQVNEIIHLLH